MKDMIMIDYKANWIKLLEALKRAERENFPYNSDNWKSCTYSVYSKYVLEDHYTYDQHYNLKTIEKDFGVKIEYTGCEKHHIFGAKYSTGPKNIQDAIIRVENYIAENFPPKKEKADMSTIILEEKTESLTHYFSFLDVGDPFRTIIDQRNHIFVKTEGGKAYSFTSKSTWDFMPTEKVRPIQLKVTEL